MPRVRCDRLLGSDAQYLARLALGDCIEKPRNKGKEILERVTHRHEYDDTQLRTSKVLLKLKTLISRDEKLEALPSRTTQ